MKAYFKLELKKNIFSLRTLIAILIIIGTFIIPCIEEIELSYPRLDGIDYFIRINQFSYMPFVGIVISGFVYSTSIVSDEESGFTSKLLKIIDSKDYFKVKLAVNATINSFVFIAGYGIFILYFIMNYGILNNSGADINEGAFIMRSFINFYQNYKIVYLIILILGTIISSMAFSTFMLAIVTLTRKKYLAYIIPIFYVILTGIVFEIFGLNNIIDFNITRLFNLTVNDAVNNLGVVMYDLILTLLGIGILYKFSYKKNFELISK